MAHRQWRFVSMSNITYISRKIGKRISKSDYKYVSVYEYLGDDVNSRGVVYKANLQNLAWSKYFDNERDAALAVDMALIKNNRKPVNILKPKE